MTLYINLAQLMKQRQMKAKELAKLTWLTPQNISIIKNRKTTQIRLSTIESFLKHLKAEPNDLFKNDNQ